MTVGDAIGLIGDLGPLIVALLVFNLNRTQARISNLIQFRAASVEDQKFRLSLLDRRLAALTVIRDMIREFNSAGHVSQDMLLRAHHVAGSLEMIFDDPTVEEFKYIISLFNEWIFRSRRGENYALQGKETERQMALDRQVEIEAELIRVFEAILPVLREATRVQAIASAKMPEKRGLASRLVAAIQRRD